MLGKTKIFPLLLAAAACGVPALNAQFSFNVDNMPVQIHSFGSQGFLYSNDNNYLTTDSSKGSFQMTDFGVNGSIRITDNFRIGAQFYDRNLGELGKWHPQLDWAVADYKFKDWFGIRGGVVKTTFGLFNDTQDMDFLRVFALLPQSVYSTDLRDAMIRHRGGDIYGIIPIKRLGSLSYTAYAGLRSDSQYGGYPYLLTANGGHLTSYGGLQVGEDLRWNTPVKGLLVGASHVGEDITGKGSWTLAFPGQAPTTMAYEEHSKRDWSNQFYGQYTLGNLELDAEYKRYWRDQVIFNGTWEVKTDVRSWYAAASYRINKRFSVGSYYSRFSNAWVDSMAGLFEAPSQNSPDRHLYDKVVSARVDLTKFWNLKVEGHFMNGYGSPGMYPDGFYTQDNMQGLAPKTSLLVVRTGFNF
jgi:hypothetical protein